MQRLVQECKRITGECKAAAERKEFFGERQVTAHLKTISRFYLQAAQASHSKQKAYETSVALMHALKAVDEAISPENTAPKNFFGGGHGIPVFHCSTSTVTPQTAHFRPVLTKGRTNCSYATHLKYGLHSTRIPSSFTTPSTGRE